MTEPGSLAALKVDLATMLRATRAAERDLFGMLDLAVRDAPDADGWSPKDRQTHLAAWRSIEARRLEAATTGEATRTSGDPVPFDPVDESNARIHAERTGWSWDAVVRDADTSLDVLVAAIERSSGPALASQDGTSAGLGANAASHAIGHLADVVGSVGAQARFDAYAGEIEAIMGRGNIGPGDSSVMYYDLACCRALAGDIGSARRLLSAAFERRPELRESAATDADLVALRNDRSELGS